MKVNKNKNLCVGIRGCPQELKTILDDKSSKYIKEIFVGAPPDIGNTGRFKTYPTDMKILSEIVKLAHKKSIDVDIVLNSSCIGENEHDPDYTEKISDFIKELEQINVDWITVAHPKIIKTIVNCRTSIKINLSLYADVNHPFLAKEFEDMGVNRITLPQTLNRDIKLIKRIKDYINIDLSLFVNSKCINSGFCPYSIAHRNFKSHQTIVPKEQWGTFCDPYTDYCIHRRKKNLINVIFTPTIRPEDINQYESIGIDLFKIATRSNTPETTIRLVKAYGERYYDGPIGGLWTVAQDTDTPNNRMLDGIFEKIKHLNEEEQLRYYEDLIKTNYLNH